MRRATRPDFIDPSAWTIEYTYNAFGQLKTQKNARNQTTTYNYHPDSRISSKVTPEGTASYSYNSNKQLTGITSPGSVSRSFGYDSKGRVNSISENIAGSNFSTTFTYDNIGRLSTRTHPLGIVETSNYNSNGYLASISAGGATRYTITAMNARQQITAATYGTSLSGDFDFDDYGYPKHSKAQASGVYKQDYRYSFNTVTGNLNSRQNYLRSKSESFAYDNLDRLLTVTGPQNLTMDYAGNGNILTKSDVGTNTFGYNHPSKPYALTDLETASGLVSEDLQLATYTSFEQVSTIEEGDYYATFTYNSDDQRAKMLVTDLGSPILTRWYVGSRYMKETAGAVTKEYTWIGGDAYSAPAVAIKQGSTTTWYYLLRDYLGNITHVVNTSNTVTAEYSYDAWGRRRDKDDWSYTLSGEPELLAGRGFTSHEQLSPFGGAGGGLYNMNGRLYDPVVGRFLSADPYVQEPGLTQSYNRYSYCLNNPLRYADISGYTWGIFKPFVRAAKWIWNVGLPAIDPDKAATKFMDWINKKLEPLSDAMVKAGIPPFGGGYNTTHGSFHYVGNSGNIYHRHPGQMAKADQKVYKKLNEVRQAHGQAWHTNSDGNDLFMGGGWHPPMALFIIDNAVNWLNNNAHESWKDASGQCAYYVRMALEAGGINTSNHPVPARLYGSYLESWGFSIENSTSYFKGDIAVIQGYSGATADPVTGIPYGHIQMYNGSIWISDFKEYNGFWPGKGYRKYQPAFTIYRWGY